MGPLDPNTPWREDDSRACTPPDPKDDTRVQSPVHRPPAERCGKTEPGPILCVANMAICRDESSLLQSTNGSTATL